MSTFVLKGKPPIRLQDLLRKRKVTLQTFLKETGITTYQKLLEKCQKLGVSPPSEEDFKQIFPEQVSSPQDGVVVLDPPPLIKDTGAKIAVDVFLDSKPIEPPPPTVEEPSARRSKRGRK